MTDLPLFADADPEWLVCPATRIEKQFALFHRTNPHVYRELERRALALVAKRVPHFGVSLLYEAMRYSELETTGEARKLNNSHRALYARLLIYRRPELSAHIELRERTERGAA